MNYLRISTVYCIPTRKFFVGGGHNVLILNKLCRVFKGCWPIAPVSFCVSVPQRPWPQSQEHPLCHTSLGSAVISAFQRHELQNQEHPLWHTSLCFVGVSPPQRPRPQNLGYSLAHTPNCSAGVSSPLRPMSKNQDNSLSHTPICPVGVSSPQHSRPQSLALSQHGLRDHTGVNSDGISAHRNSGPSIAKSRGRTDVCSERGISSHTVSK